LFAGLVWYVLLPTPLKGVAACACGCPSLRHVKRKKKRGEKRKSEKKRRKRARVVEV